MQGERGAEGVYVQLSNIYLNGNRKEEAFRVLGSWLGAERARK